MYYLTHLLKSQIRISCDNEMITDKSWDVNPVFAFYAKIFLILQKLLHFCD